MNKLNSFVLFVDGTEEEVRLLSVPHRGYAYATRDGRIVARGLTDTDAYAQLTRLAAEQFNGAVPAAAQQQHSIGSVGQH